MRTKKYPIVDEIKFKSNLEASCYIALRDNGFKPVYEPITYTVMDSFYPSKLHLYLPTKDMEHYRRTRRKRFDLKECATKIRSIKYTPDFLVKIKNNIILIETKGKLNDAYPLRKKLFLRYLQQLMDDGKNKLTFWFFEPHNLEHINQMIEVLSTLK